MPTTEVTLYRFAAQWDVLPLMLARLEALCEPCEQHLRLRAMTAMEELFTNFILHGCAQLPSGSGTLSFSVQATLAAVRIHYQDDGLTFNPFDGLETAASHVHLKVEDRPVGGLGRLLVSRLADTARYSRVGALNCIELAFVRRTGF